MLALLLGVFILHQAPASPSVFAGSTPCGPVVRAFLGIPQSSTCERVSWELSLIGGRFRLDATHGLQAVNAPGFGAGAGTVRVAGVWTTRGALKSLSRSNVHTLESNSGRSIALALFDEALMHVLDQEHRLLRGDAGWSYTLTRTTSADSVRRALSPLARHQTELAGDFEGRTPCRDLARLMGFNPAQDCTKLKWGLTFHPDGTYTMEGTLYRTAARKGSWALRRDDRTGDVIYVLDPSKGRARIALLRASDDVLFFLDREGRVLPGNASHAYTLNRSAQAVEGQRGKGTGQRGVQGEE